MAHSWTSISFRPSNNALASGSSLLPRFIAEHGWDKYHTKTVYEGSHIGRYGRQWRAAYRRGKLSGYHIKKLESIPDWSWELTYVRDNHLRALKSLRDFVAEHGWDNLEWNTQVGDVKIGWWHGTRRRQYKNGELADWLIEELESIPGWKW